MAKKAWFYGKNVVLSGASSGIGFEMAKILVVKYKCNIVGLGRTESKLINVKNKIDELIELNSKKSKTKGSFEYSLIDVSNFNAWQNLKNELDSKGFKVDVLINNAGIFLTFDKFENQDLETCKKVMETNFYSHLYSYKTFIEDLKSVKGGLINIASSASICPVVGSAIYSASKGATKNFTEAIIQEHKKELYISCVCPGFTLTELFRNEKELGKLVKSFAISGEKMAKKIIRKIKRKKRRVVLGKDAHLMSGFYRLSPNLAMNSITGVLRLSHDKMFEKVFNSDKKGV